MCASLMTWIWAV